MRIPRFLLLLLASLLIGGMQPAVTHAQVRVTTLQAEPLAITAGQTVEFFGTGFNPRERVGFWATAPDGAVLGGRYVRSNGNGEIRFDVSLPADSLGGRWSMTAYGKDSQTPAIARFDVAGLPAQTASLIVAVQPAFGPPGTRFNFAATGFGTPETVSYWFTGPDNNVYDAVSQELRSSYEGRVDISWVAPANAPAGRWVLTIQGIRSSISRGIVFEIR